MIRAVLYNAAGHDEDIQIADVNTKSLGKNQLLWIDGGLEELRTLEAIPKEIGDVIATDMGGVSLEILDPVYRFTVPMLKERINGKTHPIVFMVGKSWLVTICENRPAFMDTFVDTDRGESLNGRMTPSALAVALFSELLDTYRTALSQVDNRIDGLDDEILTSREKRPPLDTLAKLRRQVSGLRSALDEVGNTIHALTRPDFFAHIDPADQSYFEGLSQSYARLQDAVARARETIIGSFDLYTTRVAQDTNQLVKALTITTVVTGVIGAVAGIFGMNFDTPFAHTGVAGFIDVTLLMVAASVGIVGVAAWRKWF